MSADQVWLEVAKLAVQFVGAIAVARLAVRWALSRYKDEKTWERQLTAYVEVCSALGEMRLIVGRWADEIEGAGKRYSEEFKKKSAERYSAAKRNIENAGAVARLILPPETNGVLSKLAIDLDGIDFEDPFDAYNLEYSLIDDALATLHVQGRSVLGFDPLTAPKPRWWNRSARVAP